MNNLRKEISTVKVGDTFTFIGNNEFFTKGRKDYQVQSVDFNNGKEETFVDIIDDENDTQVLSEKFMKKNFVKNTK